MTHTLHIVNSLVSGTASKTSQPMKHTLYCDDESAPKIHRDSEHTAARPASLVLAIFLVPWQTPWGRVTLHPEMRADFLPIVSPEVNIPHPSPKVTALVHGEIVLLLDLAVCVDVIGRRPGHSPGHTAFR